MLDAILHISLKIQIQLLIFRYDFLDFFIQAKKKAAIRAAFFLIRSIESLSLHRLEELGVRFSFAETLEHHFHLLDG